VGLASTYSKNLFAASGGELEDAEIGFLSGEDCVEGCMAVMEDERKRIEVVEKVGTLTLLA